MYFFVPLWFLVEGREKMGREKIEERKREERR
jgi:hypothetical protein